MTFGDENLVCGKTSTMQPETVAQLKATLNDMD